MTNLKNLLKNNRVQFAYYRKGFLYYTIPVPSGGGKMFDGTALPIYEDNYIFPVPLEDIGDATFNATEKALLFMRYIRKAQEEGSFVRWKA